MRGDRNFAAVVALCIYVLAAYAFAQPEGYSVQVEAAGNEHVEKFMTAIRFYIDLVNHANGSTHEVTVSPDGCCLFIEDNDIDCEILELKPPRTLLLSGNNDGNSSGRAIFLFRNLYARYREGNCSFIVSSEGELPMEWIYSLNFNTHPANNETVLNCSGIDQDPDRGCSPVDCAIKYKGARNFYRNSTGKCEPVVDCNTRGKDHITVIGYYDWSNNLCHRYDWLEDENSYTHIESDTEIPAEVDPSQSKYFPDFEPQLLARMGPHTGQLQCNHGHPDGIYCVCNDGWISSGIHKEDPLKFHWCDVSKANPSNIQHGPRHLTKVQEIAAIVALSMGNFVMFVVWLYLVYRLCCKRKCADACRSASRSFRRRKTKSTILLQED